MGRVGVLVESTSVPVGVLSVALLVLAAGCLGPVHSGSSEDVIDDNEDDADAANPWNKETVTVGVIHEAGSWRSVTGLVAETLRYWEDHDAAYGRYEAAYDLEPNASDPDVVVRYVADVSVCGPSGPTEVGGFAPRITAANPPDPPEYICVRAGYNEAATRHILKHEFGHLLGLTHSDRPREVMEPRREYQRIPRPEAAVLNATFRSPLKVAVDRSTIYARRDRIAARQLDSVFAYYERGPDGVDHSVEIVPVDDEDTADVVLTFPRQSPCAVETGSCGSLVRQPDGRPQLEIVITTTHEDTFGWHAGFWLGVATGVDRHGDLPAPLRNATFEDRASKWWTDDS